MTPLDQGALSFSADTRLLRELGERLVRTPEVAVTELLKNAYDADSTIAHLIHVPGQSLTVSDNGRGMTLEEYAESWMRIGTSAKTRSRSTPRFGRRVTGEKGLGRFAVRFLGRRLRLRTVADDQQRNCRTVLIAAFDWTQFDAAEDLGAVQVPFTLYRANPDEPRGTELSISRLRPAVMELDFRTVRTGVLGLLSPFRFLSSLHSEDSTSDPGFHLVTSESPLPDDGTDASDAILGAYALRAQVDLRDGRVFLSVHTKDSSQPLLHVDDKYRSALSNLQADIRFYPRRKGAFDGLPVDGRKAYSWIRANSGVRVYDRAFRVSPYGDPEDDWLKLTSDTSRNNRQPRSSVARKYFPVPADQLSDTRLNWMLRLPESAQLVGVVQIESSNDSEDGLVPAADREGFIENSGFLALTDIVRGAVEAIAYCDRRLQLQQEEAERQALAARVRTEAQRQIESVRNHPLLSDSEKTAYVRAIEATERGSAELEVLTQERVAQLETMSLLGVVAGFITHEFGTAIHILSEARTYLAELGGDAVDPRRWVAALDGSISQLTDYTDFASAYVQGARSVPTKPYAALPRLRQVRRIFGKYAADRGIEVLIEAERGLLAPRVPVALYSGVTLNLYTNALKAVTSRREASTAKRILLQAAALGNRHVIAVSDTGVGIPEPLRERIFDPLFTTTADRHDALGSGMGLGLTLVRSAVESFGGKVEVVEPVAGFSTTVEVSLPMVLEELRR